MRGIRGDGEIVVPTQAVDDDLVTAAASVVEFVPF